MPGPYAVTLAFPDAIWVAGLLALAAAVLERRVAGSLRHSLLRGSVIALLVASTAGPALEFAAADPVVVLVDRSMSVADSAVDEQLSLVDSDGPSLAVVEFGDDDSTDLAEALRLALGMLPDGGRIVVLSDGRASGDAAEREAARAGAKGVSVDAVRLPSAPVRDAAVVSLHAPPAQRSGGVVPVSVVLQSSQPMTGTISIDVNGQAVLSADASIAVAGKPEMYRTVLDGGADEMLIEVRFDAPGDEEPRNDSASALVQSAPPLEALLVGEAEGAVGLADQLEAAGVRSTVVGAKRVPARLSELSQWDVIVLVDVPARDLGADQMSGIEAFVHDLGRGLVMTGGRQSYLAGGWQSTPLEDLVPVLLEPAPHGTRDPVALAFMIDQSASMGTADSRTGVTKLDLAREAAALSADVLHPGDTVGVIAYDDQARWLVPLTTVGSEREMADLQAALGGLSTGGGTRISQALETGLPSLSDLGDADGRTLRRHAVLITDGRDFHGDNQRNEAAVADARASGVTLSTIAIGFDADRPMLEKLARLGRGRYHSADDPSDLPRLAVEESEIARANAERRGSFQALPAGSGDHPVLHSIDMASLPMLKGYVSVSPRPNADRVLEAPSGDLLMATWQYGLGRVLAWTSDAGEEWAGDWRDSPSAGAFWRRAAGYVARDAAVGPPGATVEIRDGLAHVSVDAVDETGRTIDLAEVTVRRYDEDAESATRLLQTAPGTYEGAVVAGVRPESFVVRVDGESGAFEAPAAAVPGLPDELVPGRRDRLAAVAEASGGIVMAEDELTALRSGRSRQSVPLWPVPLAAASILWVLDVARQTGAPEARWRRDRFRKQPAPQIDHTEEDPQ